MIDVKNDGIITVFNIKTHNMPKNIHDLLNPIFDEMISEEISLNEEEFHKALNKLFDVIAYN